MQLTASHETQSLHHMPVRRCCLPGNCARMYAQVFFLGSLWALPPLCELGRRKIRFVTGSSIRAGCEMGNLAGKATSQRTAPEATRSTTPRTAMSGDEAPLGGVAELEDAIDGSSSDSSDRCIAGGKGKRRRGSGTDGSTPAVGGRHRGLSRSLPERVDSPDCAPFGGSLVRERPALAPVPAAKCAGFSESRLASASTTLSLRKACDRCVHVKKKCDGNTPCALCMKSHRKCIRSGPKKRHFSGDSSPPRTSGGRNSGGRGSRSEEVNRGRRKQGRRL